MLVQEQLFALCNVFKFGRAEAAESKHTFSKARSDACALQGRVS